MPLLNVLALQLEELILECFSLQVAEVQRFVVEEAVLLLGVRFGIGELGLVLVDLVHLSVPVAQVVLLQSLQEVSLLQSPIFNHNGPLRRLICIQAHLRGKYLIGVSSNLSLWYELDALVSLGPGFLYFGWRALVSPEL